MRAFPLSMAVLAVIPGCACDEFFQEADGGFPGGSTGRVSGTVSPFQGSMRVSSTERSVRSVTGLRRALNGTREASVQPPPAKNIVEVLHVTPAATRPHLEASGRLLGAHEPVRFMRGELIVRTVEYLSADQARALVDLPHFVAEHRGFATPRLHLFRFMHTESRRLLNEGEIRELAATLAQRKGVAFVELNGLRHPLSVPNDKLYPVMWHLAPINMPAAWELEKGTSNPVTVAVVDTGIIQHPDLTPRVLQGADLISDADRAQDGDERDLDPTDPGRDLPNGQSSWHGTHCAGTIGAVTDNDEGISGIHWNARIVPVRVLGKGGGTDFDIAAGMAWAAGIPIPQMPSNPNPAQVVSLSLGGEGGPLRTYQDVIDAAAARNVLFVVAAGNDNTNASTFTPCNQEGVLCIGATRFNGRRASYSNYGPRIDLMAPGGETGEDANGDGNPDGVLSTVRIDSTGRPGYQFEQGTSMAAPHIAGVLSLMKARNATMGFAQARAILVETTNRASQCDEGCGAGLVNVHAALLRVSGTMPNGPARLSLSATDLFFTPQTRSQTLTVTNVGGLSLTASFSATGPQARRIRFDSDTVSVSPGQTASIQVTADLAGLADGMTEAATISVTSNGGNATVGAKLRVGGNSARNVVVALVFQQGTEWQVAAAVEAQSIENFSYALDVSPGTYFVFGAQDTNGNQQFDDGEPIGFWPNSDSPKTLTVTPGSNAPGTNFVVAPQKALTGDESRLIGTSCTDDSMCGADGICGTGFPSGYCTRDCATTACPAGSRCLSGNMVSLCLEVCTAPRTGRSTCRAQYVCENDGAGTGICIPDCSAVNVCGTSQTCNTASGYCE